MTRDQKTVTIGAGSGVAAMLVAMVGLYQVLPSPSGLTDVGGRLGYALQANAVAILPLLAAIVTVANARFLGGAIDPTLGREDKAMQINGRVVDNTLQQFALFLVGTLALSVSLSSAEMRVIAAAAIVFVVARIVFWIGYRIHPLYRAPGMSATGYLNVGLLGFALWRAATGA